MTFNVICIPITLNNPLKVCFSNKKNTITTHKRTTHVVELYFLVKNRVLTVFKDYWCTNLHFLFGFSV